MRFLLSINITPQKNASSNKYIDLVLLALTIIKAAKIAVTTAASAQRYIINL